MSITDVIQEKSAQMGMALITASDLETFASHVAAETVIAMNGASSTKKQDENRDLIPESETKAILGVSSQTLWRWRKRGYLSGVAIGGRIKFRRTEVEKILNGEDHLARR